MNVTNYNNHLSVYNQEDSLPALRAHFREAILHGGNLDYYQPQKIQAGGGIGGVLGSIFKSAVLPTLKTVGKKALTQTLNSGVNMVSDVLAGKKLSSSLKNRGLEAVANTVSSIGSGSAGGAPRKRSIKPQKRRKRVSSTKASKRARTTSRDIFN